MADKRPKMVPPDGGWGWVVLFAVNFVNFFIRSMDSIFGLLFADLLKELNIETTGAAVITSGLDVVIHISGIIMGPMAKAVSCRKICAAGGMICCFGLVLTYPARSMSHLFITYSLIYGFGLSLIAPASFIILTQYFIKLRGLAFGFSVLGAPIGMMVMPHLIRFLLELYGFRGSLLVASGMMLHIVVAACLYQPAKWHFVLGEEEEAELIIPINEETETSTVAEDLPCRTKITAPSATNTSQNIGSPDCGKLSDALIAPVNKPALTSNCAATSNSGLPRTKQFYIGSDPDFQKPAPTFVRCVNYRTASTYSNLQRVADNDEMAINERQIKNIPDDPERKLLKTSQHQTQLSEPQLTFWRKIIRLFDLGLLKDPVYLNITLGISLFFVSDQNFKMIGPFFYDSIGFGRPQIAFFLSLQAGGDIIARILLPPIFEKIPLSKRALFIISLALLGGSRSVLAEQTDYMFIIICLATSGFFRAGCFITFNVILSQSTTFEKLPAAYGLHMVTKGVLSAVIGPILGYIRDTTRSYSLGIHLQTLILLLCCTAWVTEYFVVWMNTTKQRRGI